MTCIGNKTAKKYFVFHSLGETTLKDSSVSLHQALATAEIAGANIVDFQSRLDEDCQEISPQTIEKGALLDVCVARGEGKKGDVVSAGICFGQLQRKGSKKPEGKIVCQYAGKMDETQLKKNLKKILNDLYKANYEEVYEIADTKFVIRSETIKKAHGTVVAGLGLTDFHRETYPCETTKSRFFEYRCEYNDARYCFVPVAAESRFDEKGAGSGVHSIIEASTKLDSYDVETDSQAYKAGFHTFEMLSGNLEPEVIAEETRKRVETILEDGKMPVTLSGTAISKIGAYQAITKAHPTVSALVFDGRVNIRDSFQGSECHPYCVNGHAVKSFGSVVHLGVKTCANRERNTFNPESTWFCVDIEGDPNWQSDVMEELGDKVYISINANVFNQAEISATDPLPDGLRFREVMGLLKKVAQKKTVVGIDFVGLNPIAGSRAAETFAASIIYRLISQIEVNSNAKVY